MEQVPLKTQITDAFGLDEVRHVLNEAIYNEVALANARCAYFERSCRAFEAQYQMSSGEFMQRFESGVLGDDASYFDWYAAKRGFDLWERNLRLAASSCSVKSMIRMEVKDATNHSGDS